MEQVGALADLMPARQRMLVMVTTFASLRYGEVTALRRMDIDLARGTVSVRQAFTELRGRGMVLGPPKSRAGLRTVALPGALVAQLADHLADFVSPEPTALVFTGPKGAPIRRSNFNLWWAGLRLSRPSVRQDFTFTICGTRGTPSRPRPG